MATKIANNIEKTLDVIDPTEPKDKKNKEKKIGELNGHKVASLIILGASSFISATAAVVATVFASYILAAVCAATFVVLSVSFILVSRIHLSKDLKALVVRLRERAEELFKTNLELKKDIEFVKNQNLQQQPKIEVPQQPKIEVQQPKIEVPQQKSPNELQVEDDKEKLQIKENGEKIEKDLEEKNNQLKDFEKIKEELANKEKEIKELEKAQKDIKKKTEEASTLKKDKEKIEDELKKCKQDLAKEQERVKRLYVRMAEKKPKTVENAEKTPENKDLQKQIEELNALVVERDSIIQDWVNWEILVKEAISCPLNEMVDKLYKCGFTEEEIAGLKNLSTKENHWVNRAAQSPDVKALNWCIIAIDKKFRSLVAEEKEKNSRILSIIFGDKKEKRSSKDLIDTFILNLFVPLREEINDIIKNPDEDHFDVAKLDLMQSPKKANNQTK